MIFIKFYQKTLIAMFFYQKYKHISNLKKNIISSNLRYFIYFHVLFIGRKYDYIYLCSCQYPDYPNNLKIL